MPNCIKKKRCENGISQEILAEEAGISRPHLSDVETGKAVPSIDVALRIAKALGCSVGALFFEDDVV